MDLRLFYFRVTKHVSGQRSTLVQSFLVFCNNCCRFLGNVAALKMKIAVKDLFSKFEQIRRKLLIFPHSLKKSLTENLTFFCGVLKGNGALVGNG